MQVTHKIQEDIGNLPQFIATLSSSDPEESNNDKILNAEEDTLDDDNLIQYENSQETL